MLDNGIGNVVFGAMSQAFFTLSIGMGGMAIFGSYLDKSRSLTGESVSIVLLDTFVAMTAGLIVIPHARQVFLRRRACRRYQALCLLPFPISSHKWRAEESGDRFFFLFLFFAALSTIVGVFKILSPSEWICFTGADARQWVSTSAPLHY